MNMKRKTLSLLIALAAVVATQAREKININLGWKFIRETIEGAQAPEYNDAKWQTVDLPHDAAVHHEFQKKGDGASSRVGFLPLGRGWYRRHIAYDKAWQGKRVIIEFEGVYRDARVYVNGVDCAAATPTDTSTSSMT